jgi:hypothetical protein
MKPHILTSVLLSSFLCFGAAQAQTFTTFAVNPEGGAEPTGINDSGQVVGIYGCNPILCGFSRDPSGKMHHLGTWVEPEAVNNSGEFVGMFNRDRDGGSVSAFHSLRDGQLVKYLRGSEPVATAVNSAGWIPGSYCVKCNLGTQVSYAYLMSPSGVISNIFTSSTGPIFTSGANNLNQVVGNWYDNNHPNGFLYSNGVLNDSFNYPGAIDTRPTAINDNGEAVGDWTDSEGIVHGFYWTEAAGFTSFDAPKTTGTFPAAINASGTIVGSFFSNPGGTATSGFSLDPSGVLTAIDVPNSKSTYAQGINSQGVVVGGYLAGRQTRGFLYQPAK